MLISLLRYHQGLTYKGASTEAGLMKNEDMVKLMSRSGDYMFTCMYNTLKIRQYVYKCPHEDYICHFISIPPSQQLKFFL
jgi:hypothetical protein